MKRVLACVVTAIAVVVAPVFADLAGIDVTPNPPIPIGIVATFAARLDANPPPVVGYRWYTKGKDCGKDWIQSDTTEQKYNVAMSRVGNIDIRCDGLHPPTGMPPKAAPPTVKTVTVKVAIPIGDNTKAAENIGQPLPRGTYPMPRMKVAPFTENGYAGPYIDGTYEQRAVDWNDIQRSYTVGREGELVVAEFPFRDPDGLFNQVVDEQPFYQENTTIWITCKNWCGHEEESALRDRVATWYRVSATQWKVVVDE